MSNKKKPYTKPKITHRQKVEALAAVCDSGWTASRTCRLQGEVGCQKTRL